MRIGLFGGTFDPVHEGHLKSAGEVQQAFRLAAVYLIPSGRPPHKKSGPVASAADRLQMLQAAAADRPRLKVLDIELHRAGPSYTIDTVKLCKKQFEAADELFLIMGMDAFLEIHTWKFFETLLEEIAVIVMTRPQSDAAGDPAAVLADYCRNRLSRGYSRQPSGNRLVHPHRKSVFWVNVTPRPISSTEIRRRLKTGRCIDSWVPPPVIEYIEAKGLYR